MIHIRDFAVVLFGCTLVSIAPSSAQMFRINPTANASPEEICTFWPAQQRTRNEDAKFNDKTKLCINIIQQSREGANRGLYEQISNMFNQCEYREDAERMFSHDTIQKVLSLKKPESSWNADDIATIGRFAADCQKKLKGRQANRVLPGDLKRPENPIEATMAWMHLTESVYNSYGAAVLNSRTQEKQIKAWVDEQAKLGANREAQKGAQKQALAAEGYRMIDLLSLKADAPSLKHERVAVTGHIFAPNPNMAYLAANADDWAGVLLDLRNASSQTRARILGSCTRPTARCRFEVRGTVVETQPEIILAVD